MTAVATPEPAAVVTPPAAASAPAAEATASAAASAAAAAPAAAAVPESYDLALREGSLLAKDALARITERAKALGVADPAIAKAFVEVADTEAAEAFKLYQEATKPGGAAFTALVTQYGKAALEHPEVGKGDPLTLAKREHEAGLELAERFPQLLPILKETGYAARWEVIAAFSKSWRDRQESPLATGTPSATRSNEPMEKQMYPGGVKLSSDAQRTP